MPCTANAIGTTVTGMVARANWGTQNTSSCCVQQAHSHDETVNGIREHSKKRGEKALDMSTLSYYEFRRQVLEQLWRAVKKASTENNDVEVLRDGRLKRSSPDSFASLLCGIYRRSHFGLQSRPIKRAEEHPSEQKLPSSICVIIIRPSMTNPPDP